jgi:hypothetical protein
LRDDAQKGSRETVSLPLDIASTIGLIEKSVKVPFELDDAIMNYKYLHDNNMPPCFERSVKKLRCLLCFYGLLVKGDTQTI